MKRAMGGALGTSQQNIFSIFRVKFFSLQFHLLQRKRKAQDHEYFKEKDPKGSLGYEGINVTPEMLKLHDEWPSAKSK
jgi:hypothetical protein